MPTPKSVKRTTQTDTGIEEIEMIRFTQSLTKEHFTALSALKKAKGLQYEQDLVRIAVADLLAKNGL